MIILIAGGRRSEIFQTQFLRRQDLDWRQPLSKWAAHGGRIVNPLVCLSFPFFLIPPHLPPSPRLRPLSPHPLSLISTLVCFSILRLSSPSLSLPFKKKIRRGYNKTTLSGIHSHRSEQASIPSPWPFHTSPPRPIRALSALLVSLP
jgi:hypothetical protein